MARGHRRKSSGIRVAGLALALAGAGLTVAGVANAASDKVVDGPNNTTVVLGVGNGTDSATPTPTDTSTDQGGTLPTDSSMPTPTSTGTTTAAGTPKATASKAASSSASASASGSAGGTGSTGGQTSLVQPPARTQLAETGSSGTPMILLGGFTFVLGGAVFRFGPRAASSRKH